MSTNQPHSPGSTDGGWPGKQPAASEGSGLRGDGAAAGTNLDPRQEAREMADRVEQRAREKGEEVRERLERKGDEQKEWAAGTAEALADAMRAAGSRLRERHEERLGGFTDEFADQVDRLSGYLRDNDVRGLVHDLEGMARRNPTAFLGSTLAAGLVAGRFLRSSRRDSEADAHSAPGHATDRHRPPSHREFASNSPTPELRGPREAAESSSTDEGPRFGRETTYTAGRPSS